MKNWRLWGCLLILCFALAGWCAADAAYAAEKKSPAVENADFASLTKELNGIEEVLKSGKVDNAAISRYVSFLGDLRSRLLETQNRLNSGLKSINRRIESLGEAPKEGEEELPVIAEKRKEYNEEAVFQKGRIAENDLLINRVDELTALIVIVRNKVLFGNLFVYQDPMIYPSNLLKATGQFLDFCFNIIKSPVDWYRDLTTEQKNTVDSNVFTVILAIGATLAVGYMLRRLIIRHLGYKQNLTAPPPYFTKVMAAFFVACAYGVIPAVLLGSFLVWVIHTKILTIGFFGIALSSALYYVLYIFLANAVVRVVFAPYNGMWRLVNMDDAKAKRLAAAFYFSFFVVGVSSMLLHIAGEANYTVELIYYLSLINSAVKAFCVVLVVKRFFWEEDAVCELTEEGADDAVCRRVYFGVFKLVLFITSGAFGRFDGGGRFVAGVGIGNAASFGRNFLLAQGQVGFKQRNRFPQLCFASFDFRQRLFVCPAIVFVVERGQQIAFLDPFAFFKKHFL